MARTLAGSADDGKTGASSSLQSSHSSMSKPSRSPPKARGASPSIPPHPALDPESYHKLNGQKGTLMNQRSPLGPLLLLLARRIPVNGSVSGGPARIFGNCVRYNKARANPFCSMQHGPQWAAGPQRTSARSGDCWLQAFEVESHLKVPSAACSSGLELNSCSAAFISQGRLSPMQGPFRLQWQRYWEPSWEASYFQNGRPGTVRRGCRTRKRAPLQDF